jgi:hypothetical protein
MLIPSCSTRPPGNITLEVPIVGKEAVITTAMLTAPEDGLVRSEYASYNYSSFNMKGKKLLALVHYVRRVQRATRRR